MTITNPNVNMGIINGDVSLMGNFSKLPPTDIVHRADIAASTRFMPSTAIGEPEIVAAINTVDLNNTNTITRFGATASEQATSVSRQMLDGVRNKDTGPVGEVMSDMMLKIRGLDAGSITGGGMFGWLKSKASRVAAFGQKFEEVQEQLDSLTDALRSHQIQLMTSVAMMDRLYDATVMQFHDLEVYIIAGERLLTNLNRTNVPDMQHVVDSQKDGPDGTPASLMPQKLNDLLNHRDQLERKVHDLKLVRMVSLQSLPKIRLTQDSDNSLIAKIDTIAATTLPLWHQEMAMALEVTKTQTVAKAVSDVTDATEQMLIRGADQLKAATISTRSTVERSVVGIEAIKHVNKTIIETLDETVKMVTEGKRIRAEADQTLIDIEGALREALKKTSVSQPKQAFQIGGIELSPMNPTLLTQADILNRVIAATK